MPSSKSEFKQSDIKTLSDAALCKTGNDDDDDNDDAAPSEAAPEIDVPLGFSKLGIDLTLMPLLALLPTEAADASANADTEVSS